MRISSTTSNSPEAENPLRQTADCGLLHGSSTTCRSRSLEQDVRWHTGWMALFLTKLEDVLANTSPTTLLNTHTTYIHQHNPHGPGSVDSTCGCRETVVCLGETISGQKLFHHPLEEWVDNSKASGGLGRRCMTHLIIK